MNIYLSALGAGLLSAAVLLGSFYAAVFGSDAEAGPVDGLAMATINDAFEPNPADPGLETADRVREIPADRHSVRRVGPRFYPDPEKSLDLLRVGF